MCRCAEAVAVCFRAVTGQAVALCCAAVIIVVNSNWAVTIIFSLVLQREVQTINQTEEIAVTVGQQAGRTTVHEVVGSSPRVAAPLNQHIGVSCDVVDSAVVTTVVQRTCIAKFQTSERQTSFVALGAFRVGGVHVVFPLTVTHQLIVDLGFTFETDTGIGGVFVAGVTVGGPNVLTNCFTVEVQFVGIFVIDFGRVGRASYQQGRDYHCQDITLHHYLLPSLGFFYRHSPLPPINSVNKNLRNY